MVFIVLILVIAAIAGLTWMNYTYSQTHPLGNDFQTRWNAAKYWVVESVSPYDPIVSDATQRLIYGRPADVAKGEDIARFDYPLYAMIFFAPFGSIDPISARALWMTLSEICLIAIGYLSLKISGWKVPIWGLVVVAAFSLLWYCGARGIVLGDFAPIHMLIILAAIYMVQRKRDMDAGLLLALSTTQPQMSILVVIFALIWGLSTGRGKIALGIMGGLLFLIVLSLVFLPTWPAQWFWQTLDLAKNISGAGSVVAIVVKAFPGISNPLSWVLYSLMGIYLVLEWVVAWGRDERWFAWTALVTLVITFFVAPRSSTPEYISLIPVYFLLFRSWNERWGNGGQLSAWACLFLILVGLWAIYLLNGPKSKESVLYVLLVPFTSMLALWWVRWWSLHRPRMFFDEYPT